MNIKPAPLTGVFEVTPDVFSDHRGWFLELHRSDTMRNICPSLPFVQENLSFSKKGVIRGMHFQRHPAQQAKLVSVVHGKVLDVVVDLRKGSPDFGKTFTTLLDGDRHNMLFIPAGLAHGFYALEDSFFLYQCSHTYSPEHEAGIRWDDPQLNIQWGVKNPLVSEKDQKLPTLQVLKDRAIISAQ